jgi:hypothetical protein
MDPGAEMPKRGSLVPLAILAAMLVGALAIVIANQAAESRAERQAIAEVQRSSEECADGLREQVKLVNELLAKTDPVAAAASRAVLAGITRINEHQKAEQLRIMTGGDQH